MRREKGRVEVGRAGASLRRSGGANVLRAVPEIVLGIAAALCLTVFSPFSTNANFVKEIAWWTLLPAVGAAMLLCGSRRDRLRWRVGLRRMRLLWRGAAWVGAAWLAWGAWAAWRSPDWQRAWPQLARMPAFLASFPVLAVLLSGRRARNGLMLGLSVGVLATAAYVASQFAGHDFVRWKDATRPAGTFVNPNFTANCMAALLPVLLAWQARLGAPARRTGRTIWEAVPPVATRLPWLAVLPLGVVAVTLSRSGILGVLVGGAVLVALGRPLLRRARKGAVRVSDGRKPRSRRNGAAPASRTASPVPDPGVQAARVWLVALVLVAVPVVLLTAVWIAAPGKVEHLFATETVTVRLELWRTAWDAWKQQPWMGRGVESFRLLEEAGKYRIEVLSDDRYAFYVHSWVLQALLDQGAVGLGLQLAFWGALAWPLARCARRARGGAAGMAAGALAGVAGLLGATAADVWLNWWDGAWVLWLLFAVGAGAALGRARALGVRGAVRRNCGRGGAGRGSVFRFAAAGALLAASFAIAAGMGSWFWSDHLAVLARCDLDEKDWKRALDRVAAARRLPLRVPDVEFRAAEAWYMAKDYDRADAAWQAFARGAAMYADRWVYLACLRDKQKRVEEACAALELACAQEPSGDKAVVAAQYYLSQDRVGPARDAMVRQLRRMVYEPLLDLCLQVELRENRVREARDLLDELRASKAYRPRPQLTRGMTRWDARLSVQLRDWPRAVAACEAGLRTDPREAHLWNYLGVAQHATGKLGDADRSFRNAVEYGYQPVHAPLYNRLELAVQRQDRAAVGRLVAQLREVKDLPPEIRARVDEIAAGAGK